MAVQMPTGGLGDVLILSEPQMQTSLCSLQVEPVYNDTFVSRKNAVISRYCCRDAQQYIGLCAIAHSEDASVARASL